MGRPKLWPPRVYLHKGSGRARVRVDGSDHYLGPWGSGEASANYAKLLTRLSSNAPIGARVGYPSIAEAVLEWKLWAEERYSREGRELEQFRPAVKALVGLHAATPTDRFGVRELAEVRDSMVGAGWARTTVNRRVGRVRTCWRWLEQRGLAPPGSWAHLRSLSPLTAADRHVRQAPPREAAAWPDVAAACRRMPRTLRAMCLVQYHAGLRTGEVRLMRAGEVDRAGEVWVYRPASHKNAWRGQTREASLGPVCRKVLAPLLDGLGPGDFVFVRPCGRPHTPWSHGRWVRAACEAAGVSWHAYQLRHAHKERVAREMGLDAARAALGQKSLGSTALYASGRDRKLADEVARRLG